MKLQGKRALVTGASRGIGFEIARLLSDRGCRVLISARDHQRLDESAAQLTRRTDQPVTGHPCDVGDAAQVEQLFRQCQARLGGLDILINNAGIGIFQSVEEMPVEEWDRLIATNLNGVFYCCHFALPLLKEAGAGFIINISSLAGKNAFPKGAAYNASKFALTGFSEALMQEVRHQDIRVAYVMPGSVDTWFSGSAPEGDSWKLSPEDVAQVVVETLQRPSRCLTSRIEMRPSKPPK